MRSTQQTTPLQGFLEDDPELVNAIDISEFGTGYRPLHYAAYGGFLNVCEALHAAGARVLAAGDNGVTALFLAAQAGKADVVQFLLDLVRGLSLRLLPPPPAPVALLSTALSRVSLAPTLYCSGVRYFVFSRCIEMRLPVDLEPLDWFLGHWKGRDQSFTDPTHPPMREWIHIEEHPNLDANCFI